MNRRQDARVERGYFEADHLFNSVFQCHERQKHGGLKFTDNEYLQLQRNGAWDIISTLGNSILEGKDIASLSFPVEFFEPRSALERFMVGLCFGPTFLAAASHESDPLRRFQLTMCFVVAGLHLLPTQRAPFNPILGETSQASLSDGTSVSLEQISHHPPVSAVCVTAADGSYEMHGQFTWTANIRGNAMRSQMKGEMRVDFADGGRISFELPTVAIGGLLWGERTYDLCGTVAFRDEQNGIACDLVFNPDSKRSWLKRIFRMRRTLSRDAVAGTIYYRADPLNDPDAIASCEVSGSWLSNLEFEDCGDLWRLGRERPSSIIPAPDPLPSDSRYREDIQALTEGEVERAEELKRLLEERQRYMARLRKAGERERQVRAKKSSSGGSRAAKAVSFISAALSPQSGTGSQSLAGSGQRRGKDALRRGSLDSVRSFYSARSHFGEGSVADSASVTSRSPRSASNASMGKPSRAQRPTSGSVASGR